MAEKDSAKPFADTRPTPGRRVWGFRLFLTLVTLGIGLAGWAVVRAKPAAPPPVNPALAALATQLSFTTTSRATVTDPAPTRTASPAPTISSPLGSLILTRRFLGHDHLWAFVPGTADTFPLTWGDWDDRDPALSPDRHQVAFASNRRGPWDLYVLDLHSGELSRLTQTDGYEGRPTWSPDGLWLAYEAYVTTDLDIWLLRVDGSEAPFQLTDQPSVDQSPSWDPQGRRIAFISDREGSKDVFFFNLDLPDDRFSNLTQSPLLDEFDPAFDPAGKQLAYAIQHDGLMFLRRLALNPGNHPPIEIGQGRRPSWSPDGFTLVGIVDSAAGGTHPVAYPLGRTVVARLSLPGDLNLSDLVWLESGLPGELLSRGTAAPAPESLFDRGPWPQASADRLELVPLTRVSAPRAMLSTAVDEAFDELRERIAREAGWDFLARLDNAYAGLNDPLPPGFQFNDWLYTGRAFAFSEAVREAGWLEVVREDFSGLTYWRVYVRASIQDGSLGEPLRTHPWDFRGLSLASPLAYDQGGSLKSDIPQGYYVDFTLLAEDFGFDRLPSLANWRTYLPGTRYNEFVLSDGLTWEEAMLEIYPASAIITPTPFRTPTPTATRTPWPTPTPWWWRLLTPSPSPTFPSIATPAP